MHLNTLPNVPTLSSPDAVARELIDAFNAGDLRRMRSCVADDLVAYITNREGGVDEVRGADGYLSRLEAMDLPSARFSVTLTQVVTIRLDLVMAMVEVRAARGGRTLHNHAAHLLCLRGNLIAEWWMVEALPAESDAFWSAQERNATL
jgi:ketosteroid isomerase-like protein